MFLYVQYCSSVFFAIPISAKLLPLKLRLLKLFSNSLVFQEKSLQLFVFIIVYIKNCMYLERKETWEVNVIYGAGNVKNKKVYLHCCTIFYLFKSNVSLTKNLVEKSEQQNSRHFYYRKEALASGYHKNTMRHMINKLFIVTYMIKRSTPTWSLPGSIIHLHFRHINFCFSVSIPTLTRLPVTYVWLKSVRCLM